MVETLAYRSPLEGLLRPGTHGRAGTPGVQIRDGSDRSIVSFSGQRAAQAPGCVRYGDGWLVTSSPDQSLWVGDSYDVRIQRAPDGTLTTDLSGSRAILKLEGAAWREVISALVPIDVHPEIFPNGAAAASVAGYMPVVLWRAAGLEGVEIATYRSFAGSLWHMVERAAEPFGFHITE